MVLEFELVFCSSMGYVYLQLQDKIFQKFHMQSLYLIHPVKVPIEGAVLFELFLYMKRLIYLVNGQSSDLLVSPLKNTRPRYISALKKVVPDISRPKKSPLQ